MQSLPSGRHTASNPGRARPRARSRRRRVAGTPYVWVILVGVVSALVGAVLVFGSQRQSALYATSGANGPLLGSSVLSMDDLAQETAEFGHMSIDRVYYPGLPSANAWTTGLPAANESAVIVSFKALPTTILSGADDAVLTHFFDTAPTGHPIYYSYYHEPEDNISAGQFTLADYKAAWAHVVALADAAHNPDLHSTLILMEWDLQKASGRDWKSYLPGGGIISTLGWDAYPAGSATNQNPQPTPPADFMGPAIAASESVGLPYGFAEFGLSTSVGRAAWMTEVGNYLMNSGALFASLFNGNAEYPTLQLTDSASIAVWRSFVSGSGGSTPAPTPSDTPTSTPTPPSTGLGITGLALDSATLASGDDNHIMIDFTMSQSADVTICILNSEGDVVRILAKPDHAGGLVRIPYYGYNGRGQLVPSGSYTVLVVASNAGGSATAESTLTINAP